jgi:hypothetical protein
MEGEQGHRRRRSFGGSASTSSPDVATTGWLAREVEALGQAEMRSWSSFFERFKPPKSWSRADVGARIRSNVHYYRGNYLAIFVVCLLASVIVNPLALLVCLMCALICVLVFVDSPLKLTNKPLIVAGREISESEITASASVLVCLLLFISGVLFVLWYGALVAVLLSLLHATFRPRTMQSKFNEKVKENIVDRLGARIRDEFQMNKKAM